MSADLRIVPPGIVAHCNTCQTDYTREQWQALALVGHQPVPADDADCDQACFFDRLSWVNGVEHVQACAARGYTLEMRNCPCKSTLAVRMDP